MSYEIKNQVIDAQNGQGQNGPIMPAALDLDVERSVRLYPRLAAAVAIVVFVGTVGYALKQKPMYSAETTVYIQPVATKLLSDGTAGYYDSNKYDSYLQQQILTATRSDILADALAKMPAGTWQQPGESSEHAIDRLQSALKVQRVQTSYQLTFNVTSPDKAAVAPAVNAVTTAFLKLGRKDELSQTDDRMQLLAEERDRISKELEGAREEQRQLSASIGVANPAGDAANPYDMQLGELRSQLAGARQAHDVAASQLETVSGPSPVALDTAAEELIQADNTLAAMKTTISERKGQLTSQMAGLTPNNPLYKQDQLETQQLDKSLDTMTAQMREKAARRLQDKLRLDLVRTADVESRLNAQLAKQTSAATGAAPKLQRANDLAADVTRMQQRYATIDDTMRSLALESSSPGLAHLVVGATPPDGPDPSRQKLMLLLAFLLAPALGVGAAVIATKRDRHVFIGKDLDKLLGFQPIAVLPARADVSQGVLDEYVLRLAAGIDQALRRGRARSYLLTSATASVDTSHLVRDLADKMEQLGFRTVLVSAAAVLQPLPDGGAKADSVSISRGMPSALSGVHQSLLVANLERLKRGNDLLLIESDALLVSAETEYVARLADVTILIAESGVTLREEMLGSASLLKRLSASGVGAVLTEVHLSTADQPFRTSIKALEGRQYTGTRTAQERPVRASLEEREHEVIPAAEEPEFVTALEFYEPAIAEPVTAEPVLDASHAAVEEIAHVEPVHIEPAYEAFVEEPVAIVAEPVVAESVVSPVEPVATVVEPVMEAVAPVQVESVQEMPAAEPVFVEPAIAEPVHHEPTIFAQYAASAAHFDPHHVEAPVVHTPRIVEVPATAPVAVVETVAHAVEATVSEPVVETPVVPQVEAADLHFDPTISRQRLAFRGASGRVKVEEEEQPKRSWVHRLFRRDQQQQVSYSIIPEDDEDDIEEYAATPVPHGVTESVVAPAITVAKPVMLAEAPHVAAVEATTATESIVPEAPAVAEAVEAPAEIVELPTAAAMEPAPEVHWQPLVAELPHSEEPVVEHVEAVAEAVPAHAERRWQQWIVADEPAPVELAPAELALAPVAETPVHADVAEAVLEEPTAESVNSVVEPLVADLEPVAHHDAVEIEHEAHEPVADFEVSMPMVPMSSDFEEQVFEPLPETAMWPSFEAAEPASVAETSHVKIEPVSSTVAEPEPMFAPAAPVETPEPVYAAAEPAYVEPAYAAAESLRTHREVERTSHAPARRFHLLNQFDRPLTARQDVRESNGGQR